VTEEPLEMLSALHKQMEVRPSRCYSERTAMRTSCES
jgi:hypothetical protein